MPNTEDEKCIFHLQFTFQLHTGLLGSDCGEYVQVNTSSKHFLLKCQSKSEQCGSPSAAPHLLWGRRAHALHNPPPIDISV